MNTLLSLFLLHKISCFWRISHKHVIEKKCAKIPLLTDSQPPKSYAHSYQSYFCQLEMELISQCRATVILEVPQLLRPKKVKLSQYKVHHTQPFGMDIRQIVYPVVAFRVFIFCKQATTKITVSILSLKCCSLCS